MKSILFFSVVCGVVFQSCNIISYDAFPGRDTSENSIVLSPQCKVDLTGAVVLNMACIKKTDFIPPSTKIEFHDKLIYIDPFGLADSSKADFIFISHNHSDHFFMPDIKKILKEETIIIGPKTVTKKLEKYNCKTLELNDTISFGKLKCEVVESYNLKKEKRSFVIHKRTDNFLGYILNCDSFRIYFAGDTDFIPEMENLKDLTIAIVPIGVGNTAMTPQTAAAALNIMQPTYAVPMHYELGINSEAEFEALVNENIQVQFFQKYK